MAINNDTASLALFCDFENIALGVRDARYDKFDIRPVLERLLAKGSIVVKKAYCDWDRYKTFKAGMHEANFELIEIPHVRQSGKNSADIRLVVDALDLCYTKSHVDTFVIISGDSDFSPLVSKLRENAKRVIGVGVKQSCSDLLIANCDEFIYYDDLVRDQAAQRRENREAAPRRTPEEESKRREKLEARKTKAVELAAATFSDMVADRGDSERIWASVLKEVIKRRNPGFNENYFGFRSFGNLLEETASRGLIGFGRDDKGAFVFRVATKPNPIEPELGVEPLVDIALAVNPENAPEIIVAGAPAEAASTRRRGGRRTRHNRDQAVSGGAAVASLLAESGVIGGLAQTDPECLPCEAALPENSKTSALLEGLQPRYPVLESVAAVPDTLGEIETHDGDTLPPSTPVMTEGSLASPPAKTPRRRASRRTPAEPALSAVGSELPVASIAPQSQESPDPLPKTRKARSRKPVKQVADS